MSSLNQSVFFGAIADDFTGASDLAALLARSGAPVSLRFGLDALTDDHLTSPFEVIALKIRTEPVEEAVDAASKALEWLIRNGAQRFFWKYCSTFDSTAEGNIGPVSEALMKRLKTTQTIYCPAFPQNGRSIYSGYLYVNDLLLSDSPMKDHPLTPMRDANLMRLLEPQVTEKVGHIAYPVVRRGLSAMKDKLRELAADNIRHIVTDAIDDDHLAVIAGACQNMTLLTGGSAVAMPLPSLYRKSGDVSFNDEGPRQPATTNTPLVICGSCSQMTRKQIAAFRENYPVFKIDSLILAEDKTILEDAKKWLESLPLDQPKLIFSSDDPVEVEKIQTILGRTQAGMMIEDALSEFADYAIDHGIRRIVVAGGETSGAVVSKLGIQRVDIGPEITPGVPWTFANLGVETAAIALKSGNFGDERFFLKAFDVLN